MQHHCLRNNTKIAKMHSELHNKNIIQKCEKKTLKVLNSFRKTATQFVK